MKNEVIKRNYAIFVFLWFERTNSFDVARLLRRGTKEYKRSLRKRGIAYTVSIYVSRNLIRIWGDARPELLLGDRSESSCIHWINCSLAADDSTSYAISLCIDVVHKAKIISKDTLTDTLAEYRRTNRKCGMTFASRARRATSLTKNRQLAIRRLHSSNCANWTEETFS